MNSIKANPLKWGNPILLNKDNAPGYNLSVVIDDSNQNITHVTRGEDLYETTHIQILLYRLFDLEIPKYCHHPILKDKNGKKLSKSKNSISLKQLKSEGTSVSDIIRLTKIDKYNDYFEKLNKNIISI